MHVNIKAPKKNKNKQMEIKPKNGLLAVQQYSNLSSLIVLEIKDCFQNMQLAELRMDPELVTFICRKVDHYCDQQSLISKKVKRKIDKVELVRSIFQSLFNERLSDDEMKIIDKMIAFTIENRLSKKRPVVDFFRAVGRLLIMVVRR